MSQSSPTASRRVPGFTPVPLRPRADGWTPWRQVEFIGWLAETGSVRAAAERVGMARETAYRLRRKPGAQEFARAWEAALAVAGRAGALRQDQGGRAFDEDRWATTAPAKVTPLAALEWLLAGRWRPVIRGGKFVACVREARNSEVLQLLGRRGPVSQEDLAEAMRNGALRF